MKHIFLVLFLLYGFSAKSQDIIPCDSTHSYWVLKKENPNIVVKLKGKIQKTQYPTVIGLNDYALQYLITNKKPYNNSCKKDLEIILKHVMSEVEHQSKMFKAQLKLQMQKVVISENLEGLLWHYEIPKHISQEVKSQVFISIIIGDYIVGVSATQFINQNFDHVKNFLMEVARQIRSTDSIENICK